MIASILPFIKNIYYSYPTEIQMIMIISLACSFWYSRRLFFKAIKFLSDEQRKDLFKKLQRPFILHYFLNLLILVGLVLAIESRILVTSIDKIIFLGVFALLCSVYFLLHKKMKIQLDKLDLPQDFQEAFWKSRTVSLVFYMSLLGLVAFIQFVILT